MQWKLIKKEDKRIIEKISREHGLSYLQAKLLYNRDIISKEAVGKYLYGNFNDLYNPETLKDSDKAVEILKDAFLNFKKILIYADYDADGITSAVVCTKALRNLGLEVVPYIPDRRTEGYGINKKSIENIFKKEDFDLIITVDNGIRAHEAIEYIVNDLKKPVIITDHHDCSDILPPADAVVNVKRQDDLSENKSLCGCTTIWKIMYLFYKEIGADLQFIYDLSAYCAIATIADIMDLTPENRIFVTEGLKVINQKIYDGLSELMEACNIQNVTSESIGFFIAPCINAAGRLKTADIALNLLLEEGDLPVLAQEMVDINTERKQLTAKALAEVFENIKNNNLHNNKVIVSLVRSIDEGLVGLVAGKVKELFNLPCIIFTEAEDGTYKGSGRGVEGSPVTMAGILEATKDYWTKGGGHDMACGLTLPADPLNFLLFEDTANVFAEEILKNQPFEPSVVYDDIISCPDEKICEEIKILEPTGKGNPKAVFLSEQTEIAEFRYVGDGTHVSFNFMNGIKGIAFGKTAEYTALGEPSAVKILYSPEINIYTYKKEGEDFVSRTLQMQISNLKKAEQPEKKIFIAGLRT